MKLRATLKDYHFNGKTLFGKIYDDQAGRFEDGKLVVTSSVIKIDEDWGEAETKHTKYKLVNKAGS